MSLINETVILKHLLAASFAHVVSASVGASMMTTQTVVSAQDVPPSISASEFADRNQNNSDLSVFPIFAMHFTPKYANSILWLTAEMPYFAGGNNTDSWLVTVWSAPTLDFTQGVSWITKTQRSSSGGGTRSSPLFPLHAMYVNVDANPKYIIITLSTTTDADTFFVGNPNMDGTQVATLNTPPASTYHNQQLICRIDELINDVN